MTDPDQSHPSHLPRLPPEYYQGDAVVHWTLTSVKRGVNWLADSVHGEFRELMLHVAARERLLCPIYCWMPDHLHLVWMGLHKDSHQQNAMAFLRTYLARSIEPHRFQPQAHDHVLRTPQRRRGAFVHACSYILANPVSDGLCEDSETWRFSGAVIPGYPDVHPVRDGFWKLFWKLYARMLDPSAKTVARPRF